MPFSFRQPAKEFKDLQFNNDVSIFPVRLSLKENIEEGLPIIKEELGTYINSLFPFSIKHSLQLMSHLPYDLLFRFSDDLTKAYTLIFSNINATKRPWQLAGAK